MSDQYGQQPTPYPQPGPGTPPPPPPGMYPPTGTMTPPPQPPKKKRTGLIIAIVAVILGVCALGACGVGIAALSGNNSDQEAITVAEGHLQKAVNNAESIIGSTKKATNDAAGITAMVTDAQKKLRAGRDEVATAKAAVEGMKDSQGKTDYLNALKSVTEVFDALEDALAYLGTLSGMASKTQQAATLIPAANDNLNDAITSGNLSKYSAMKSKATAARDKYAKAEGLMREAHAIAPAAGLNNLATYCQKRKEEAKVVIRMAGEGKAGKISAYNADIKKQKALFAEAERARGKVNLSDSTWIETAMAQYVDRANAAAKQADTLREKALKEFGYTVK